MTTDVFNLLRQPWIPVQRRNGERERISPAQIADAHAANPIIAIDWPRPDFRVATIEFLIGLLSTACPPADDVEDWLDRWHRPPTPEDLGAAFTPIAHAFNLDGNGPRFMQDWDANLEGTTWPVEALLLDSANKNSVQKGRVVFQKPATAPQQFSCAAVAIALYTLQSYAPQGGSGNGVSLRGGAPLTTLIIPGNTPTLWHTVWANTPCGKRPTARQLSKVFPWLAPTRGRHIVGVTRPDDVHELQSGWAAPRRIRIKFDTNEASRPCDLTGAIDATVATEWIQAGGGPEYVGWTHPLSPYQQPTPTDAKTAVRGSSDTGYGHWVGWLFGDARRVSQWPARVVSDWFDRLHAVPDLRDTTRVLAVGFVSSEGSVTDHVESEMPVPGANLEAAAILARTMVEATGHAASILQDAARKAARSKSYKPGPIIAGLWRDTEFEFHRLLRSGAKPERDAEQALNAVAADWLSALRTTALALFDAEFPIVPGSQDAADLAVKRRWLRDTFAGRTHSSTPLFHALQLPLEATADA
jgi:CRISPR system Cascade subunit CasA